MGIEFFAWLAGFVDGEGTVYFDRPSLALVIPQKYPAPLAFIKATVRGGTLLKPSAGVWRLRFRGRPAYALIAAMWPYLRVKREQAVSAVIRDLIYHVFISYTKYGDDAG